MTKERVREKAENQYRAKVSAIFAKYQPKDSGPVKKIVWNIPEKVPPPANGDWWGPWRYNAKTLEIEYYDEEGKYKYGVDLQRCNSSAKVLDWIFQVDDKHWGYECTGHLVQAIRDLLDRNFCSGGQDRPFDAASYLRNKQG